MNLLRVALLASIVSIGAGLAHADGIDGRVNVNGGGPGSPSCGSMQFSADSNGNFTVDCTATALTTTITFAALESQTNGGLSCQSQLTSIGWTETSKVMNGVASCTFTAPSTSSLVSDGDCDLDDFGLGIAKGCDVKLTTVVNFPFTPGATGDLSVNGASLVPFPEPASLGLLATGIGVLFFWKRRWNGLQVR